MLDLSTPLRDTWDLPPDAAVTAHLWRRLAAANVLSVEILVDAAALAGPEGVVSGGMGR